MTFKTPKILRRHIRVMHQGQVFQCPCCDHQAVEGYRLKVHMKSVSISTIARLRWLFYLKTLLPRMEGVYNVISI